MCTGNSNKIQNTKTELIIKQYKLYKIQWHSTLFYSALNRTQYDRLDSRFNKNLNNSSLPIVALICCVWSEDSLLQRRLFQKLHEPGENKNKTRFWVL